MSFFHTVIVNVRFFPLTKLPNISVFTLYICDINIFIFILSISIPVRSISVEVVSTFMLSIYIYIYDINIQYYGSDIDIIELKYSTILLKNFKMNIYFNGALNSAILLNSVLIKGESISFLGLNDIFRTSF